MFQKVSGWLFSSQQTSYDTPVYNSNSIPPVKKDCNPCNLVPWIPVIRYNLGAKNVQQNVLPTYGPPSPTAYANSQNLAHFKPQPFHSQGQGLPQLTPGVPHAVYGPPAKFQSGSSIGIQSSTYGPPSPTHTIAVPSQSPPSSPYSVDSSSFSVPSSSYGVPSSSFGHSSSSYNVPSSTFEIPSSTYGVPSSTYGASTPSYATPSPSYGQSVSSGFEPVTPNYDPSVLNNDLPQQSDVDIIRYIQPSSELQLPRVTHPSGFRNSYGEPITSSYDFNIPYPVSATAAESMKIKTEVLPHDSKKTSTPNMSLALANPAPFTLNRGRNIHTLQPVALPNLSVSPLPPIFNARPFRPIPGQKLNPNFLQGLNYMQQTSNNNNVNIEQSVPIAEYTHSIDYPPTVIKSPVIDIDAYKTLNYTKAYRNIPNSYIGDEIRDISSQASEDHVSATKSNQDASFESTGEDVGNDLYDNGIPSDLKHNSYIPSNHKTNFADLRGIKDEDVDKYRTESNLQNIDSPLLYLKPSAPHKDFGSFVFAVSTPANDNEYELYDDVQTTTVSSLSTLTSSWDESRNEYSAGLVPPPVAQEDANKPKIVQIIVPYTTGQQNGQKDIDYDQISQQWATTSEDDYQGRKVPTNTENSYINPDNDKYIYSTVSSTTEDPLNTVTEYFDSERLNTQAILNDLYDVKEPPFDIIKLQHTIDDWTQQEYSHHYKAPQKTRASTKYAKQIPDEYFTTLSPITNYVTANTNYNYEFYDHEGASSINHPVTDDRNKTKAHKQYNSIERTKTKHSSGKNEEPDDVKKPHIYTAASSFRSTTSTPAPWETIQTSISPLTKEKVYVVTSKPWRESTTLQAKGNEWYDAESFESKKTNVDNDVSASDNLPFKSPRFSNRPSFGFSASAEGKIESLKSDSSYGFSKSWHQSSEYHHDI